MPQSDRHLLTRAPLHQQPKTDARPDSKSAILKAAAIEFAERGFDGVRIEHVAARSGFNKSLVYKHFGNREGLFQAVLDEQFSGRAAILSGIPDELGDVLVHWDKANRADPTFGKLIIREALDALGSEPVRAAERTAYYQKQVAMIRSEQEAGNLPKDLDTNYLFLALLAIVTLPAMLPQIAELATGSDLGSKDGQQGWHQFLRAYAQSMSSASTTGE